MCIRQVSQKLPKKNSKSITARPFGSQGDGEELFPSFHNSEYYEMAVISKATSSNSLPNGWLPIYVGSDNTGFANAETINSTSAATTSYSSTASQTEELETNPTPLPSTTSDEKGGSGTQKELDTDAEEEHGSHEYPAIHNDHHQHDSIPPRSYQKTIVENPEPLVTTTAREQHTDQAPNNGGIQASSDNGESILGNGLVEGSNQANQLGSVHLKEGSYTSKQDNAPVGSSASSPSISEPTEHNDKGEEIVPASSHIDGLLEPYSEVERIGRNTTDHVDNHEQGVLIAGERRRGFMRPFRRVFKPSRKRPFRSIFKLKRKTIMKAVIAVSTAAGGVVTIAIMVPAGKTIEQTTGVLLVVIGVGTFAYMALQSGGEESEHHDHMRSLAEQEDGAVNTSALVRDEVPLLLDREEGGLARR